MTAYGVMFHHFHDDRHPPGQGALSRDELAEMLNFLGRERILPAREWMDRAVSGMLGEDDLCLTFDDALLCQYEIAVPVLRDLGLTAFWFVYSSVFQGNREPLEIYRYFRSTAFDGIDDFYAAFFSAMTRVHGDERDRALAGFDPDAYLTGFPFYTRNDRIFRFLRDDVLGPDRYYALMDAMIEAHGLDLDDVASRLWMTDTHLRELDSDGHMIGLHSFSHPTRLSEMPIDRQRDEYRRNAEHLTRVLGTPPVCMSHPCNSYAPETLPILEELGIRLGFRANMQDIGPRGRYEFPRDDHANILKKMRP